MSALALIKQMPESKAQMMTFVKVVKDELLEGYMNPLQVEKQLKILEEVISTIRKDPEYKDYVIRELDKYKEKTTKIFGCEITKVNRSSYDYSVCNDSELELLQMELDLAKAKVDQRKEMLKNISGEMVNQETGEKINPALKLTTETFSIKIL